MAAIRSPLGLLLLLEAGQAVTRPGTVHVVFCAECTHSFDWKSIGVFHSHNASGFPGRITRLLACSQEQLKVYEGLDIGPTFVHPNYGVGEVPGYDRSPTYNKPASLMHWVQEAEIEEEFVLYIDADMLLRRPMDPAAMGARKGIVISEHVRYLDVGVAGGLAEQFLPPDAAPRAATSTGGWYHLFHVDDARKIAPRWLHYCREVRTHVERYWTMPGSALRKDIPTGDSYVRFGEAPWISEMYGYVFAAAEAGVSHVLTEGAVVYSDAPLETPGPYIVHYGLHCYINVPPGVNGSLVANKFHFTKYHWSQFDAHACSGTLFPLPPQPDMVEGLCSYTVETLNDGLSAFYNRHCGLHISAPAHQVPRPTPCLDLESEGTCQAWARARECDKNPKFMLVRCKRSCGLCPVTASEAPLMRGGLETGRSRDGAHEQVRSARPLAHVDESQPVVHFVADPDLRAADPLETRRAMADLLGQWLPLAMSVWLFLVVILLVGLSRGGRLGRKHAGAQPRARGAGQGLVVQAKRPMKRLGLPARPSTDRGYGV